MTQNILDTMVAEMGRKTAPLQIVCEPVTVLHLAGLVQLALRHPGVSPELQRGAAQILSDVRVYFADCPAVLAMIQLGDDPANDIL